MFRRIIAYLLFGSGFLVIAFFRNYSSHVIPYPVLWWLIGVLCFISGWLILRFTPTVKQQQEKNNLQQQINELKSSGEQIVVKLADCEIKSNNYIEEKERYGSDNFFTTLDMEHNIQFFNALGDETRNTKRVSVNQAVLIYILKSENGEQRKIVSHVLPYERTTLLFKLAAHETTKIYLDKNNRNRYYFDLEFLAD